jgi:hypothetical protein
MKTDDDLNIKILGTAAGVVGIASLGLRAPLFIPRLFEKPLR